MIDEAGPVVTDVPRQSAAEATLDTTAGEGSGRRRRSAPEAPQAPQVTEAPAAVLPAPTGRRRRAADETAFESVVAPSFLTPVESSQIAGGTGRRRKVAETSVSVVATPIAAPEPAPPAAPKPVAEVAASVAAPTIEPAARAHHRAAPAKKAAAKPAAAKKAPAAGHAARTSGHAAARRKVIALPAGTPSGTALIAGAAAVAVAAVGAIGAMNSDTDLAPTAASVTGASVLGLSEGGALVESASVDREQARASRERARDALADRAAAALALQKKQEAAARALAAAKARVQQLALLAKDYSLPVSNYHLTAGFGEGGYRWSSSHTGLDFACAYGSPIRAVAAGTVIFAGYDGSYGWKTIVRHADGTESWYAHQSQILVRRGQVVAGQIIGRVGMTGNTSGPHLHLEIRVNDQPINPLVWLRAHGLRP